MSDRKLASVRKISEVAPIEGADLIEKVRVDGWWVVTKRGEFLPGDLCCYFEVDSVLPVVPEFEFLRKSCYVKKDWLPEGEGFRLKTVRLRGQVSQGLVVPKPTSLMDAEVGDDLTSYFNVVKWDPPVPAELAGVIRGNWIDDIPKTDEERIQNLVNDFESYKNLLWEASEKLEGSSCTFALVDSEFYVCSRNVNLKETPENTLWQLARKYNVESKMRDLGLDNLTIQGEVVGPGIQGNYYDLKECEFFVFRIYDTKSGKFLSSYDRLELVNKLGLKHVPVVGEYVISEIANSVSELLLFADGNSRINPSKLREGLVYKQVGGQLHFKTVSDKYLLKTGQ